MYTHTDQVKKVPDKFFLKEIKSPFLGKNIKIYADLKSASHFHNGALFPVLVGIRKSRENEILSEDNSIEIFLKCVEQHGAATAYRITYRLHEDDKVQAMTMIMDDHDIGVYSDPFI